MEQQAYCVGGICPTCQQFILPGCVMANGVPAPPATAHEELSTAQFVPAEPPFPPLPESLPPVAQLVPLEVPENVLYEARREVEGLREIIAELEQKLDRANKATHRQLATAQRRESRVKQLEEEIAGLLDQSLPHELRRSKRARERLQFRSAKGAAQHMLDDIKEMMSNVEGEAAREDIADILLAAIEEEYPSEQRAAQRQAEIRSAQQLVINQIEEFWTAERGSALKTVLRLSSRLYQMMLHFMSNQWSHEESKYVRAMLPCGLLLPGHPNHSVHKVNQWEEDSIFAPLEIQDVEVQAPPGHPSLDEDDEERMTDAPPVSARIDPGVQCSVRAAILPYVQQGILDGRINLTKGIQVSRLLLLSHN